MNCWISVVLVSLLCGCVSPTHILDTSGPTMMQIMDGSHSSSHNENNNKRYFKQNSALHNVEFTSTSETEVQQLFPMLPNPTIKVYVFPHISTSNRAPVPGYTTAIHLFERDEYALPSERVR